MIRKENNLAALRLSLVFILASCVCLAGCGKRRAHLERRVSQKGLILYFNKDYFYFIPLKDFADGRCLDLNLSDNFEKGFQFGINSDSQLNDIESAARTYEIENVANELKGEYNKVSIVRAEIEYELINDRTTDLVSKQPHLNLKINNKIIGFDYDLLDVNVQKLTISSCEAGKALRISNCHCNEIENDSENYLFKVCKYLKQQGDSSNIPCSYGVKGISKAELEGQPVIKVELNCCYLGDVAFFDPKTKKLIKFYYGAK
jgi:hypothetical protein